MEIGCLLTVLEGGCIHTHHNKDSELPHARIVHKAQPNSKHYAIISAMVTHHSNTVPVPIDHVKASLPTSIWLESVVPVVEPSIKTTFWRELGLMQ